MNFPLTLVIHGAGLLVILAVILDGVALTRGTVTVARRPLYVYRGAVKTVMMGIYLNYLIVRVWHIEGLPRGLTSFATALVFFLIGLEWVVSWFVDRAEYRQSLSIAVDRIIDVLVNGHGDGPGEEE